MKYFLIGRNGTGKKYLAKKLAESGFKVTTACDPSDMLIEISDIIIATPKTALQIAKNMSDTAFHIIYLTADLEERLKHIPEKSPEKENKFYKQHIDENQMFSDFEKNVLTKDGFANYTNITAYLVINNDYENTFDDTIQHVKNTFMLHNTLCDIVSMLVNTGTLTSKTKGKILVYVSDKNGEEKTIEEPIDCFANRLIGDNEGMSVIMKEWLIHVSDMCPNIIDAIYSYSETDVDKINSLTSDI